MCALSFFTTSCSDDGPQNPVVPDDPEEVLEVKARAGISDDDFCRHIDIDNIHRTIPVVNRYLDNLPGGLTSKQRAQSLVALFLSFDGVTAARLLPGEDMNDPAVFFSFMDESTDRELTLDFSSTGKVLSYHYDITNRAYVKIKRGVAIDRVFDLINSVDFDVDEIMYGVYVSSRPSSDDELQRILDALNAKPYTNDGDVWWTIGYLHYQTGEITIFPHLMNMNNRNYQADWLSTMSEYSLTEILDSGVGYVLDVIIPEDRTVHESHWKNIFNGFDIVELTDLSGTRYVLADGTINGGYEDGIKAVDSKIHISPVERYETSPRTFHLHCATEKSYSSGSNPIIVTKEQSANVIDISFKGVAEIGMTTDIGPARAYIDLGALPEGTYTLNFYNGDVKQTGRLVVSTDSYAIEFADSDIFGVSPLTLNRIPENTIWGYVAYHKQGTATLVDSFLNDLVGAGAVKKSYLPGYYREFEIDAKGAIVQPVPGTTGHYFDKLFIYGYSGDLADIDRLVRQYALNHGADMSIMINAESGEEFMSWMYDR